MEVMCLKSGLVTNDFCQLFDFVSEVKDITTYLQIHNSNLSINAEAVYVNYMWIVQNQILCVTLFTCISSPQYFQ